VEPTNIASLVLEMGHVNKNERINVNRDVVGCFYHNQPNSSG
jgi:hypothetical protein